jgi:uncharacterized protein YdaU (DUF1376 family)
MTGRAWMPLYIGDYMGDTWHLSRADHGSYLLLIFYYWNHGGLPADETEIADIAKVPPEEWPEARKQLLRFFHHGWRHKRIDRELAKCEIIKTKRAIAGAKGGKTKRNPFPNSTELTGSNCKAIAKQTGSIHNHIYKHCRTSERNSSPQGASEGRSNRLAASPELAAAISRKNSPRA